MPGGFWGGGMARLLFGVDTPEGPPPKLLLFQIGILLHTVLRS